MKITWSKPRIITPDNFTDDEHAAVKPLFPMWGDWLVFRMFWLYLDNWAIGTVIEVREKRSQKRTYFAIGCSKPGTAPGLTIELPAKAKNAADSINGWVRIIERTKALSWAKKGLANHAALTTAVGFINEPGPVSKPAVTYNTGDTLRNGCTVVDFNRDTRIVLAKSTDRFCGGTSMPYITWVVMDCGGTLSGCYYNTLAEAAVDAKRDQWYV